MTLDVQAADSVPCHLVVEAPGMETRTLYEGTAGAPVLSDYLRVHGVPLNTRCGGRGLCESCTVELVGGSVRQAKACKSIAANGQGVMVKACEVALPDRGHAHIRVPARAFLRYEPQIVTDYRVNIACGHDPLFKGEIPCAPGAVKTYPLGMAIDIGTTTVAALLVDLTDGKVLAQAAMFNQQMNLGDDVVTRIELCAGDKSMIKKLQAAVARQTIVPLVDAALAKAGMKGEQIRCYSIAGNTTMLHLIAGIDPTPLGTAPFTPAFLAHRIIDAGAALTGQNSGIDMHLLPSASAYVGADLTAGVVASGMLYDPGPSLLVDVGTNGEIVLKFEGKLFGCATAAGPAFEGAGLSCGMRAGDGVIAHVQMSGRGETFQLKTQTIGEIEGKKIPAVGICGSAYIDFLAEARQVGLIGETGRFQADFDTRGRIIRWDDGHDHAFVLGYAPGKKPLAISERDVASLLQAKAATAAGVLTLLSRAGIGPADIKTVYLAGGFGTKMKAANAIACGLLPGFTPAQIQPVGNTSLAGAYLAMLDASLLNEMRRACEGMQVIELNLDPDFEDRYIEQLALL